jgi:hypothetical protein
VKQVFVISALALTVGLSPSSCDDRAATTATASKDDSLGGLVMGVRGDDELMVGPVDGQRAFVRKVTRAQIEACTRTGGLLYPDCLP